MKQDLNTIETLQILFRPKDSTNKHGAPHYLTFTAAAENSSVAFYCNNEHEDPNNPLTTTLEYSAGVNSNTTEQAKAGLEKALGIS